MIGVPFLHRSVEGNKSIRGMTMGANHAFVESLEEWEKHYQKLRTEDRAQFKKDEVKLDTEIIAEENEFLVITIITEQEGSSEV